MRRFPPVSFQTQKAQRPSESRGADIRLGATWGNQGLAKGPEALVRVFSGFRRWSRFEEVEAFRELGSLGLAI